MGCDFLLQGMNLPDPGIEPTSPVLAGGFFTTDPPGKPQPHMDTNLKSSLLSLDMWFKGRWCPEWALDLWLEDVGSASVTLTRDFSNTKHKYCLKVYCVPNVYQTLSICILISSFCIRQDSLSSLYIQEDWGSRERSSSPSSRAGIQIHMCLPRSFHCNTHVL